jgi:hypothetical protein
MRKNLRNPLFANSNVYALPMPSVPPVTTANQHLNKSLQTTRIIFITSGEVPVGKLTEYQINTQLFNLLAGSFVLI